MFASDVAMMAPVEIAYGAAKAIEALKANPANAGATAMWTPARVGLSADGTARVYRRCHDNHPRRRRDECREVPGVLAQGSGRLARARLQAGSGEGRSAGRDRHLSLAETTPRAKEPCHGTRTRSRRPRGCRAVILARCANDGDWCGLQAVRESRRDQSLRTRCA